MKKFRRLLPKTLSRMTFITHSCSLKNVQEIVSEADGYQPHLIVLEQGYRRIIYGSTKYFKGFAETSADAVIFLLNPYPIILSKIKNLNYGIYACLYYKIKPKYLVYVPPLFDDEEIW